MQARDRALAAMAADRLRRRRACDAAAMSSAQAVTLDELVLADEPGDWAALGFTVADAVVQLGARSRAHGRRATPGAESSAGRWAAWPRRSSTACRSRARTTPPRGAAPQHRNGIVAIDHVVAMTPDLDRSVRALQARRAGPAPRARAADARRSAAPGVLSPRRGDPRGRPGTRADRRRARRRRRPGAAVGSGADRADSSTARSQSSRRTPARCATPCSRAGASSRSNARPSWPCRWR